MAKTDRIKVQVEINDKLLLKLREKDAQIEKLKELVYSYQRFTKWVLRYTKEIAESQRGRDWLIEIDKIEAEIAELEKQLK